MKPPYTFKYVRWCGRTGSRGPSYPIRADTLVGAATTKMMADAPAPRPGDQSAPLTPLQTAPSRPPHNENHTPRSPESPPGRRWRRHSCLPRRHSCRRSYNQNDGRCGPARSHRPPAPRPGDQSAPPTPLQTAPSRPPHNENHTPRSPESPPGRRTKCRYTTTKN